MASELTITARLRFRKGNVDTGDHGVSNLSRDVAGDSYQGGIQSIGTSFQLIVMPSEIGTTGFALFRNQDTTNYIQIGRVVAGVFYPCIQLLPGEPALFRFGVDD